MKYSLLDKAIHKDKFIGRRYVKSTVENREKLLRFRESFNRPTIEKRTKIAQEMASLAPYEVRNSDGYLVVPDADFPQLPYMINHANQVVAENDVEKLRKNKKAQLMTGLLKKDTLNVDNPFVEFATSEAIVSTVSNYLGMIPVLTKIDIWYSKATGSQTFQNSQLHHCDFESYRQLKLFIYCTDVPKESGPLVLIDAENSDKIQKKIDYRFGQKVEDRIIDPVCPPEQQLVATGSKGNMIFADTSRCFHYGSRVAGEGVPRIVILLQYLRPQSFLLPLKFQNNSPFSSFAAADMPEYKRLLLGAE